MLNLETCVVRVCDQTGRTCGTGFIVADDLLVTCAHVIEIAGSGPGERVSVIFHINDEKYLAEVLANYWRSSDADDIAFLRLPAESRPLPKEVHIAPLGSTSDCYGHKMQALGFPPLGGDMDYSVAWVSGTLQRLVPHPSKEPMLQMEAAPIHEGLSGAPVLDRSTGRVVGMISEFKKPKKDELLFLEWSTTAETLHSVAPTMVQLHPPEAVDAYLAAVQRYCANMPYLTIQNSGTDTQSFYVSLYVRPSEEVQEAFNEESGIRRIPLTEPLSIVQMMQMRERPHMLILGEPGAGKSALLRHLAECAWQEPAKIGLDSPHLPLLVPLGRLADIGGVLSVRLHQALSKELALIDIDDLPQNFYTTWPAQTGANWLLLFDALDEVSTSRYDETLSWLNRLLPGISPYRLLITCRQGLYQSGDLAKGQFACFDLVPFNPKQSKQFAKKWFQDSAQEFLSELQRVRVIDLCSTPLLMTIAATVYTEEHKLPERRPALYEKFVDISLNEAKLHGLNNELGRELEGPVSMQVNRLAHLAFWMTEHPTHQSLQELSDGMAKYLHEQEDFPSTRAKVYGTEFIKVMARRSGVFTVRGGGYTFIHPTFRGYLASLDVVNRFKESQQFWKKLASYWIDNNYHEVAMFTADILSHKGHDIRKLIPIWRKREDEGLMFAAHDLIKQQLNVENGFRDGIIAALVDGVRNSNRQKLATGFQMTAINGLRFLERINELLSLGCDSQVHSVLRLEIAGRLMQLGRIDESTQVLLALACDGEAEEYVRIESVKILYRRRNDKVAEALLIISRDQGVSVNARLNALDSLLSLGLMIDEIAKILVAIGLAEEVDVCMQIRAAHMLRWRMGLDEEAVSILIRVAHNKRADPGARFEAAVMLDQMGRSKETSEVWSELFDEDR